MTIHDGSPYAQQLQQVFADNFKAMGGKVLSQEAIAPTDVDMHPVLTRIASEKPDMVYFPVFTAAAAQILRQAKETPGLEKTKLMGGGSLLSADFIEAAGPAVVGFIIGYPDLSPEAMGKNYPKFVEAYKKAYGEAPISGYHANAYDGAMLAIKAIEKVAQDRQGRQPLHRQEGAPRRGVQHQVRRHQRTDRLRPIWRMLAVQAVGAGVHVGRSEDIRYRQEPEEDLAVIVSGASTAIGPWRAAMARFNAVDIVLWALRIGVVAVVVVGTIATLITNRYTAAQWFDFVMFGLTIGSIYAQIALGYTMVYGVLRLINFAHGDIVMTGAFAGYFVADPLERSGFLENHPVLGMGTILLVAVVTSTTIAVLTERIAYRPFRRVVGLAPLICAIGVSFFLEQTFRGMFGSAVKSIPRHPGSARRSKSWASTCRASMCW